MSWLEHELGGPLCIGDLVVITGDQANWRHGFDVGEVGTVYSEFGKDGYLVEDRDAVPWRWAVHKDDLRRVR